MNRTRFSLSNPVWLRLARWSLVGYAVFLFSLAIAGLVLFPAYARQHVADFTPNNSWSAAQTQTALAQLGWPSTVPAYVALALNLLYFIVAGGLSLFLLLRRARSWYILYLVFVFLNRLLSEAFYLALISRAPWVAALRDFLGAAGWQFLFILFYFFPNGRPVPRWTRWFAFAWLGLIVLNQFLVDSLASNASFLPLYMGLVAIALLSQVYRYFFRSNAVERQQTKWVVAVVLLMLVVVLGIAPRAFNPPSGPDLRLPLVIALANSVIFNTLFTLVPLAIVVAVFKYRLWDIDVIIRKTLVYSVVTGLLVLVYLGGVLLLQGLFAQLGAGQSPAALVLSTLASAALFNPLRRRVQEGVDRRFYRKKYNAEGVLAAFAAQARDEVDIERLSASLVEAVEETVQPQEVNLWLRKAEKKTGMVP